MVALSVLLPGLGMNDEINFWSGNGLKVILLSEIFYECGRGILWSN